MKPEQMPNGNDNTPMTGQRDRKPESRDLSRPAFPRAAERAGITTSAMVRDAARLRTVMTRAVEDATPPEPGEDRSGVGRETAAQEDAAHEMVMHTPSEGERNIEPAIEIPLPDLESGQGDKYPGDDMPGTSSPPEPDHIALEKAGYGATKIVMPKGGNASSTYRSEPSHLMSEAPVATGGATRLRPVAALRPVPAASAASPASPIASEPRISPAGVSPRNESRADISRPQEAASVAYNDLWDAAAAAATPKVASESWQASRRENYEGRGGGFKRGAVAVVMVLAGTTIGIGLYIGGSGFLSEFFSNKNEGVATLSPSAVTELPPALTPEEPVAQAPLSDSALMGGTGTVDNTVPPSASLDGPIAPAGEAPKKPNAAAATIAVNGEKKPAQPKSAGTAVNAAGAGDLAGRADAAKSPEKPKAPPKGEEKGGSGKKDDAKAATGATEERGAAANKYIVQVRATSDESEANLIAKRLRKKGISDVQVVRSEKNGAPFYRIRFTAAGTSGQAQEKAKSAGYADAWVVRQR